MEKMNADFDFDEAKKQNFYDWDKLLNGETWVMGEDDFLGGGSFRKQSARFRGAAHQAGRRTGRKVRTHVDYQNKTVIISSS